jgi:hypothetical protein
MTPNQGIKAWKRDNWDIWPFRRKVGHIFSVIGAFIMLLLMCGAFLWFVFLIFIARASVWKIKDLLIHGIVDLF